MTENGEPPEKPGSPGGNQGPSAPRSVRDTLGGGARQRRGRSSNRGRSKPGGRGRSSPRTTPPHPGQPPPASRIATRTRTVEIEGVRWTVEVEGSSYIGRGSHRAARLLSLIFRATEGAPHLRGPVYAVATDLGDLAEEEVVRLFESSQDVLGGSKDSAVPKGRGQGRRPRPKGV